MVPRTVDFTGIGTEYRNVGTVTTLVFLHNVCCSSKDRLICSLVYGVEILISVWLHECYWAWLSVMNAWAVDHLRIIKAGM